MIAMTGKQAAAVAELITRCADGPEPVVLTEPGRDRILVRFIDAEFAEARAVEVGPRGGEKERR